MTKDKDTENLKIPFFSYPGENAGIHQEAKQAPWHEPLHRPGPAAPAAVQDLMNAFAQESALPGSAYRRQNSWI